MFPKKEKDVDIKHLMMKGVVNSYLGNSIERCELLKMTVLTKEKLHYRFKMIEFS